MHLLTWCNTVVSSVVYLISPPRFSGSTQTQTFYLKLIDLFSWGEMWVYPPPLLPSSLIHTDTARQLKKNTSVENMNMINLTFLSYYMISILSYKVVG